MLTSSELKNIIEEAITAIWVNEIQADYRNMWLLKEDTLKNAIYFHLRNRLGKLMDENGVRIYTEFTDGDYKHSGYRPDMVIAKVDASKEVDYWGDSVTECLAVIELKYKSGFAASEEIYADYAKLRNYVEALAVNSRLYMATIWEYEDDESSWIEGDADWANGKITELNASYQRMSNCEPQFYVIAH